MYTDILFFFNDTATTEIYTLSLHDALPIFLLDHDLGVRDDPGCYLAGPPARHVPVVHLDLDTRAARGDLAETDLARGLDLDRKSTRLNSSHANISYAVFCLKKKNTNIRCSQ